MLGFLEKIADHTPRLFRWLLLSLLPVCFIIRLAVPYYAENNTLITDKITDFSGRPAIAERIDYHWNGWSPQISVLGLKLLDDERENVLLYFPKVSATISLLESISRGTIATSSIYFDGLDIEIRQSMDGKFRIVGMPPPKFPIFKWLLQQNKVVLSKSDIRLTLEQKQQTIEMRGISAISNNLIDGQIIQGEMEFREDFAARGSFSIRTAKNIVESPDVFEIDFNLESAKLDELISRFTNELPMVKTLPKLDVTGWSKWENYNLRTLDFSFSQTKNSSPKIIPNVKGDMTKVDSGWNINFLASASSRGKNISLGEVSNVLVMNKEQEPAVITKARNIDLGTALRLKNFLLPNSADKEIFSFQTSLEGKLKSLTSAYRFNRNKANDYLVRTTFNNLSSRGDPNVPAFSGLSGEAEIFPNGADLTFVSSSLEIMKHPKVYRPLLFEKINGKLTWRSPKGGEHTSIFRRFSGTVNNMGFALNGHAIKDHNSNWHLDGILDIDNAPASHLHHLIPANSLPEKGDYWLRHALEKGVIDHGSLIIRGPMRKFPFRNMEGLFLGNLELVDGKVKFSKFWPAAENVNGFMKLRGTSGYFDAKSATIKGVNISSGVVTSSDLFAKEKYVQIEADGSINGGIPEELVRQSPLKDTGASQILNFVISDTVDLSVDMSIPLFAGGKKSILGKAFLRQNDIKHKNIDLIFKATTGTLVYDHGKWNGTDLKAMLDNANVKLDVRGGINAPSFNTEFVVTGTTPIEYIFNRLARHSPSFMGWLESYEIPANFSGTTSWKNVLRIPKYVADSEAKKAHMIFSTDLEGVTIALPEPFKKHREENMPLVADLTLRNGKVEKTIVNYAQLFKSEAAFVTTKTDISTETLSLNPPQTERNLSIDASIEYLPTDTWLPIIKRRQVKNDNSSSTNGIGFTISAKKMTFLGHQFNSTTINVEPDKAKYLFNFSGHDLEGVVSIPKGTLGNEIKASLERLRLIPQETGGKIKKQASIKAVPSIVLEIKSLMYHGIQLGNAQIVIQKSPGRLDFTKLNFQSVDAKILAEGSWEQGVEGDKSSLKFSLTGEKASKVMEQFGFSGNNIKGGATELNALLHWPDAPQLFDLKYLSGNLDLKITDGRFKDIEPGAGRIFGLLSVQSLPRRLSLDFKDLFKKGFSFDKIEGSFSLNGGNAHTDSLAMNGPSAKIEIRGRTGLVAKDYDQKASVSPALSNSIPVASALFGPVGIGAGAVYYIGQKVFKSLPERVDNFLKQEYSIKGSWKNPSIERL
jgi:uncharacterized protein (TIGR02099 family)